MSAAFEPTRGHCLPALDGPPVPRDVALANVQALGAVADYEDAQDAPADHREEARARACARVLDLRMAIHKSPEPVAMPAALAEIPWEVS